MRPSQPQVAVEGAVIGAAGGVVLTLRNLFDVLLDDRIDGVSVPMIHRFLATEYRAEVVRASLELVALSVVVGAVVGVLAAVGWRHRQSQSVEREPPPWLRWLSFAAIAGFLLGWVYLHDVAARPAIHQAALYSRGGLWAWLQVVVADGLGTTGVLTIGFGLICVYWGFPADGYRAGARSLQSLGGTLLIACVLVLGLEKGPDVFVRARSGARQQQPNVLLLAADSLRPDRLDEQRAPNLTRLAGRATRFERAYTPLARTFPAWVSILTGQYPQHHGIRHMFPRWESRARHFDTLGSRFARAGYHTAVVGDFAADIFRRISLGYGRIETPTFTMRELVREHLLKHDPWLLAWVRGRLMRWLVPVIVEMHEATDPLAVTRDALAEIDREAEKPFFVTVFYSTTHFPYASPAPDFRRYRESGYRGPYRYAKSDTLDANERMNPADIVAVRALYDGAVHATDEAIGELLAGLERRGLRDNTIVVVTADHGEELYEHGHSQGHGDHLQGDEALHVPLMIAEPSSAVGHQYPQPVSLVDLAPTLLELARLEPLSRADGRSLAASMRGEELAPREVYSETGLWFTEAIAEVPPSRRIAYPDLTRLTEIDRNHSDQVVIRKRFEAFTTAAKHRMLQSGSLRLIYLPTREGPKFELCDLVRDPGCDRDIGVESPEPLEKLKASFWRFVADDPLVYRQGDVLLPRSSLDKESD